MTLELKKKKSLTLELYPVSTFHQTILKHYDSVYLMEHLKVTTNAITKATGSVTLSHTYKYKKNYIHVLPIYPRNKQGLTVNADRD